MTLKCKTCGKLKEQHFSIMKYCGEAEFEDFQGDMPMFSPEDDHEDCEPCKAKQKKGSGKVSDFEIGGIKNWICLQEDKEIIMEVIRFSHKKLLSMEKGE